MTIILKDPNPKLLYRLPHIEKSMTREPILPISITCIGEAKIDTRQMDALMRPEFRGKRVSYPEAPLGVVLL